jgi:hypothetical protein
VPGLQRKPLRELVSWNAETAADGDGVNEPDRG